MARQLPVTPLTLAALTGMPNLTAAGTGECEFVGPVLEFECEVRRAERRVLPGRRETRLHPDNSVSIIRAVSKPSFDESPDIGRDDVDDVDGAIRMAEAAGRYVIDAVEVAGHPTPAD